MRLAGISLVLLTILFGSHFARAQSGATVEGSVSNETTHLAVPNVNVTLWTQKGAQYSAVTDASGKFQIVGVAPGEYDSRFDKPGFPELRLPTFGKPGLHVGSGGTARIDVELVPFATLRGRVLGPDGEPRAKVSVEIGPFDSEETDSEGHFTFRDLRPGTYTLRAAVGQYPQSAHQSGEPQIVPTYYPSSLDSVDAERIRVRGGDDLSGYEIRLRTSVVYRVGGLVLDDSGKPVPNANIRLFRPGNEMLLTGRARIGGSTDYLLNLSGTQIEEASAMSDEDGAFEFPSVLPGDWRLQAALDSRRDSANNPYAIHSSNVPIRISDTDIANVSLRLEPTFTVQFTFDWGDRTAPANAKPDVMLIPSDGLPFGRPGKIMPDGTLQQEHVGPGPYRIVPLAGSPRGYYPAAVMLGGRDVLGQEVDLTADMTAIRVVYRPNPATVRGTVENGVGANVLLWREETRIPYMVPVVEAGRDGSFEFPNVPPGRYSVVAFDRVAARSKAVVLGAIATGTRITVQEGGAESVELTVAHWPD